MANEILDQNISLLLKKQPASIKPSEEFKEILLKKLTQSSAIKQNIRGIPCGMPVGALVKQGVVSEQYVCHLCSHYFLENVKKALSKTEVEICPYWNEL